jgi:hypothetical protein
MDIFLGLEDHTAAVAAVAAVGASTGNELFPAEANTAVAAPASFHVDFDFIDEHGSVS